MKKGISIWSFPAMKLQEAFLLAKDAGFEGVEVALDESAGEITLASTEKELFYIILRMCRHRNHNQNGHTKKPLESLHTILQIYKK